MVGQVWTLIVATIRRILQAGQKKLHRRGPWGARLGGEALEPRVLLAADQIVYDAATHEIAIQGTTGSDVVSIFYSGAALSDVTVRVESFGKTTEASFARLSVSAVTFSAGLGDDRFTNQTALPSNADGSDGNDTFIGGSDRDEFYGGAGNDVLLGGAGNDHLDGQYGHDQLYGGAGDDYLHGEWGDDKLYGQDGNDTLAGSIGNDVIYGAAGDDSINGSDGNDRLFGDAGVDSLIGGGGDDVLYGGDDDDSLNGQAGNDVLEGGDGDDYLQGEYGIDWLYGGNGDDRLYGNVGADLLYGQDGADELDGGADNDWLDGGIGNDRLLGNSGVDQLYGSVGADTLNGQDGDDTLHGGEGDDSLYGEFGNDWLYGDEGHDSLDGSMGHDTLYGRAGDDTLDGGDGNDRIFGQSGADTLIGGAGYDIMYGGDDNDQLNGQADNDVLDGGRGNDALYGEFGSDWLFGGDGDDVLEGSVGNDRLYGQAGIDQLNGGDGNDHLDGGIGNDHLIGGGGKDNQYGGDGDDTLNGQDGNDLLHGGAGDDVLYGEFGDDWLVGNGGNDTLSGSVGNDTMYGGYGSDHLDGSDGNDTIYGDADDDTLLGGAGDDLLLGGAGNDHLDGQFGDDTLFGEDGNDYLQGEFGNDLVVGGDGADNLYGLIGSDVLIGGSEVDHLDGGDDDDLIIGSATNYDSDMLALRALFEEWSSAATYETRVQNIEGELFIARLESEETIFDDHVADMVFGGAGQDWFFQTGLLTFYSPLAVEPHQDEGSAEDPMAAAHHHPGPVVSSTLPMHEGFDFIDTLDHFNDHSSSEQIHSKVPHADALNLQREHLALFELVRYDQVSHIAIANGNWSSPGTWQNGVVPGDGAHVLVPVGVEIVVDDMIEARLKSVRVDGKLSFVTDRNSELRVDTIVATTSGTFEMGTVDQPISAAVTARLLITGSTPIDRTADPFGISRGLISHGAVSIHGATVVSSSAVVSPAVAGTSTLLLSSAPWGWQVGDTIVLASTVAGAEQNEVRHISAIEGNLITLDQPLTFDHIPYSTDYRVHVAHLTRNAVIESESTALDRRGHVMFMHNRNVNIGYAGFYKLGRTNKEVVINDPQVDANWNLVEGTGTNPRARYSVHFHRNGSVEDGNPSIVMGSAVVDSPGWGYVNHSSYVAMTNNVAYGVHGAAFTTEVGDEIGSFIGNMAIGTTGSGEMVESRKYEQDFGHQGDGFWFQGGGVSVTNNVSAGNEGSAFIVYSRALGTGAMQGRFLSQNLPDPSIAGGEETIEVGHVPMFAFDNNTGYASAAGLRLWYHLNHAQHNQQALFQNSDFWNNTIGIDLSYTENSILRDLSVVQPFGGPYKTAISINAVTSSMTYENLTVAGYNRGIEVPRHGHSVIYGGYLNNIHNIVMETALSPDRSVTITGPIQFGGYYVDIQLVKTLPVGWSVENLFYDDRATVDFGPYSNQRLYYREQAADYVPFPVAGDGIPEDYIGLTNDELQSQFGVSIGGAIAPDNAITDPLIVGLIGPAP